MADREVHVGVVVGNEELIAGRLWSHRGRGVESATFAYDAQYLTHPAAYELDPGLPLVAGPQQTPVGTSLFGAFADCAPDRWGRRLIAREERRRAREEGEHERSFGELDLLLGVRDDLRQGALRFRDPADGTALAPPPGGVPPLVELPRLLAAAERLERDEPDAEDLRLLLQGGSSLGGARPKAHVRAADGRLAIAKFPSPSQDDWDVIRWEAVALELARRAGVHVASSTVEVIADRPVLIVARFDRVGEQRVAYVSAMTMLEARDGDQRSYLEIADVILRMSPRATADLHELWRRIAFSVAISNTDDHLRNHGFLRTSSAGWSLAPAFDINPDPRRRGVLSTAIDFDDPTASFDLLRSVAREFRLSADQAEAMLGEVSSAVGGWREAAVAFGIGREDIEVMAPAFMED